MTRDVLRALMALQEVDKELWKVREELRRLPQERQRKRAEIDGRLVRLGELDAQWASLKSRTREIEDLTTTQRQRMRKLENEAASSRGDAALLAAFQHEIRSLRREVGDAEDEGIRLVGEAEALDASRRDLRTAIEAEEKVFAEFAANIERELAEAGRLREQLEARRAERMGGEMEPDLKQRYERLLTSREGSALAQLDGRICQGCYITVPPNIFVRLSRGQELVQCPSCDRILYLAD